MQNRFEEGKHTIEMKALMRLCGDVMDEEELKKQLEESNGNVSMVIEQIVSKLMAQNEHVWYFVAQHKREISYSNNLYLVSNQLSLFAKENEELETDSKSGQKAEKLRKEEEKVEVGETEPGINLQGYCVNPNCLVAKAKLPVWVNIGFGDIAFTSDKTSYCCPDCRQSTIALIMKAMIFNSEHSICASDNSTPVKDNHYQCIYAIKTGLSYSLTAKKIRQHATSLEDLINRSEHAMVSNEIINLVTELQKYLITVVKPSKVKDKIRLLEKIKCDYNGDFNQVFDVGRFTILCDNATKLQTAVAVMKQAEQFNLVVSEDKDFFERQSKTHHRFHNIKLYVPKHDNYTTLEGYTIIENPKLSHLFYELVRAWKPNTLSRQQQAEEEEDLKQ
ncbi:hypothetical protein RFI_19118, partial [Reticulomyxa filosa]